MQCPILYFTDNLIFNADKSVWAGYKMVGYDYDFLDDDLKIQCLYKLAKFLGGIMSEAQILIVPVEQDTKEHFRNLIRSLDSEDALYEKAKYHAEQTEAFLKQVKAAQGESSDYRSYILVKLADNAESELVTSLRSGYQFFLKNPVNAINVFMNLDSRDILMSKLNDAIKKAEKWFFAQNQRMSLIELKSDETQWLLRRMAFRGLNKRVKLFQEDAEGTKEWKPKAEMKQVGNERVIHTYGKDIVNLFSGSIHTDNRMIYIEHDKNECSYQTFLALTNIPDTYDYPGMEWIYMLQQYNMQAEMCIHIKAIDNREAQRKLDGQKREIQSQMEHIVNANAKVPEDLAEGMAYAEAMETELKTLRDPLLRVAATICIASDDREELECRVTTIKNEYEELNFIVERPLADQMNLYFQCMPTVGCIVTDYILPITPLTLASGVIGATHELGDKKGPYIGTTGVERKSVFLELGLACLRNMSASATFYGNLGVGKSFNANLLMLLTVLYGGYGLIFDPKAERSHWETDLKMLKGMITTVTLSSDPRNKGKLDPYNLYRDDHKAADELAVNILAELLKISPTSTEYTAILEAQRIMQDSEMPSMRKLMEVLGNFPETDELQLDARHLSRRLKLQADAGMAQLLFGDGTEDAISLDNRLNILQIDNLKLPSPETPKEDYTAEETLSTVLMATISNFAKRFAMIKRPVFKLVLFDESWMLGKTTEGVKLYDFLTRMGRSLYCGCIFNGHSVLDLPTEGIRNTISYKFCFKTTNDAEAARMCEYMGLEVTERNKETLKALGNGECLFQDLDGHVGVLKFDAVFQDIIDVFSTTPKTEKKVELQPAEGNSSRQSFPDVTKPRTEAQRGKAKETANDKVKEKLQHQKETEIQKPTQEKVDVKEPAHEDAPKQKIKRDSKKKEETLESDFNFEFTMEELFRKEEIQ